MAAVACKAVVLTFCLWCLGRIQGLVLDRRNAIFSEEDYTIPRPKWPEQYQLSWEIDIPYMKELQKGGLKYQYQAWQDNKHGRQKTTRNGVESVIEFVQNNTQYQIYPRIDKWGCRNLEIAGGAGPTRRLLADKKPELTMPLSWDPDENSCFQEHPLSIVLPDLREERWHYNSSATIEDGRHKGANARAFSWIVKEDDGYGEVTATYTFFLALDDTPLRLFMWGRNLYTDGHFDAYIVDYYDYRKVPPPPSTWSVPDICPDKPEPSNHAALNSHWLTQLRATLPATHYGDVKYDAFAHKFGRRPSSRHDYEQRTQIFHDNRANIDSHNSRTNGTGHRLGINHFADWTHEEYLEIMLPNRGRSRPPLWADGQQPNLHTPSVPQHMLPSTVDWRGTGADSPVKDQAMCGSCWAFGAVGSLESAYYRAAGEQKLLSEQHLMDCSWDEKDENKACMGGFQNIAFQWVLQHGGIASQAEYPYEGVTNFCQKDALLAVKFEKGKYVEVQGGEKGLMEALLTKGPMTVSVDAEPKSFTFYESGIYSEPTCKTKLDSLDHAVIVSGYGTENGQDFWIVKNTWSRNWGEDGYLRIARQPDDCGISTQPIYLELEIQQ